MTDLIAFIWTEFFYRPTYNLIVFIYHLTPGPNYGWAIVGIAILIRFLFLYFSLRGLKTDAILESLSPQIQKIETDKTLSEKERRNAITALLKGKDVHPYAEFYAVVAQLLFLAANYQVLQVGLKPSSFATLYFFVPHPSSINTIFFSFDLTKSSYILSFFAASVLFIEQVIEYNAKKNIVIKKFSEKWFPLLLSLFTFILLVILPSAKAIFISVSVIFSLFLRAVVQLARNNKEN